MNLKWISRRLSYLLSNPRYFYLYFYGKPENVISAVTGISKSRFFELKEELDNDLSFKEALQTKARKFLNLDFAFDRDHYFLYALTRTIKPTVILETGVFHGFYTACFLKGIEDNYRESSIEGKVISIDLPAYETVQESTSENSHLTRLPEQCEPGWVIPDNLQDRWKLHIGDSRQLLPLVLEKEKDISLFFHDSLHTYSHMMFEFETVYPFLGDGAYMMTHDVHWNRSFRHFSRRNNQTEYSMHGFGIFKKGNRHTTP